jgi:hypothetical protein
VANGPRGKKRRGRWAAAGKEGEEEGLRFYFFFFFKSFLNNFSKPFSKSKILHFFITCFTNYFKDF